MLPFGALQDLRTLRDHASLYDDGTLVRTLQDGHHKLAKEQHGGTCDFEPCSAFGPCIYYATSLQLSRRL
jgi:hypothetical protein